MKAKIGYRYPYSALVDRNKLAIRRVVRDPDYPWRVKAVSEEHSISPSLVTIEGVRKWSWEKEVEFDYSALGKQIPREGLVLELLFWEGEGTTAHDTSGYGNNGTIYGATWKKVDNKNVLYFDGIDDYLVVEPFTVYGWSEITIEELIYPFYPKANDAWSKFSMIGDTWTDYPSTYIYTDNKFEYTAMRVTWKVRKSDGTAYAYNCDIYAYKNSWIHLVRRFTAEREYSVWVNAERKLNVTVPSDEKTVLEWNPDTASHPERYKRFVLGANVGGSEYMKVEYAFVRIYNRALTEKEIKTLYEQAKKLVPLG